MISFLLEDKTFLPIITPTTKVCQTGRLMFFQANHKLIQQIVPQLNVHFIPGDECNGIRERKKVLIP